MQGHGKSMAGKRPGARAAGSAAPARIEDRQSQLLQIAGRLFAKHGFKGTSLRDIAEEAKITKAALYYHFPNKEALHQRIVLQGLGRLLETVQAATDSEATALGKVRAFMLSTADHYELNRDSWITGSDAFRNPEAAAALAGGMALRDQYEKHLRSCIRKGIKSGEFRDVDPAIAGRALLAAMNSMSRWHKPDGPLGVRAVMEQFLDIILKGLCAD